MRWRRVGHAVLGLILLLLALALLVQAFPGLVGAEHALIVQSGSMEPSIKTGAIVFVSEVPAEQVQVGDVITYADDGENLVTHRVVERHDATNTDSVRFITQGDANEAPDGEPVYRDEIVGQVTMHLPLIGYIVAFGQTQLGWVVFILVPMLLLIASELWSLYVHMRPEKGQ